MKELLDGFSVERLEEIADCCWMDDCALSMDEAGKLARIALAVKQAEPIVEFQLINDNHYAIALLDGCILRGEKIKLFDVPQPAPNSIALQNFRTAMEGIGHIRRTLEETFGGLHGTHCEPDVLAECKAICDAICDAYRKAAMQPIAVRPNFVIPEPATLTNINQLCPLDLNLSQTDFATGWNECRKSAKTHGRVPPIVKDINANCRGWNACRDAMRVAE